jgi:type II secretory pathway pseudopilin PulG
MKLFLMQPFTETTSAPAALEPRTDVTLWLSKNGNSAEKRPRWAMPANNTTAINGESGFTLIDLLFTASLICLLATMAVPGLMRARGAAQSASAVGTLRVVNSSQLSFAVTCGSGFYSPNFQTLGVIPPNSVTAFLPAELSTGTSFVKQGYSFSMSGTSLSGAPATCNGLAAGGAAPGYTLTADPLDAVGNPHFYGTNADGTIYVNATTMNGYIPESGPPPIGTPVH